MDFLKYFKNDKYIKGINDCWTLVQDIFKDEQGIVLPECPIMADYSPFESKLKSNLKYQMLDTPHEGCLIHFRCGRIEHIGYAIDDRRYIHKTFNRVEISPIPLKAKIYKVFK